jgi:threonine/homoserine/homoserine lactone efflux protein
MVSKIPNKNESQEEQQKSRPLRVWEAVLFQVVNPKAFVITTTAVSTFALQGDMYLKSILLMCVIFLLTGPLGMGGWMFLGTVLSKLLKNPVVFRSFNIIMGLLTFGSAFWAF